MNTSRRQAIRWGLCATASLVAVPGFSEAAAQAVRQPSVPVDDGGGFLRRDLFESRLGEAVTVRAATFTTALRLMRVDDQPGARQKGTAGDENNFVVVFRGPSKPKLDQGTYTVDSRSLGTFQLFLVPDRTTGRSMTYTATFNRLA